MNQIEKIYIIDKKVDSTKNFYILAPDFYILAPDFYILALQILLNFGFNKKFLYFSTSNFVEFWIQQKNCGDTFLTPHFYF